MKKMKIVIKLQDLQIRGDRLMNFIIDIIC